MNKEDFFKWGRTLDNDTYIQVLKIMLNLVNLGIKGDDAADIVYLGIAEREPTEQFTNNPKLFNM